MYLWLPLIREHYITSSTLHVFSRASLLNNSNNIPINNISMDAIFSINQSCKFNLIGSDKQPCSINLINVLPFSQRYINVE